MPRLRDRDDQGDPRRFTAPSRRAAARRSRLRRARERRRQAASCLATTGADQPRSSLVSVTPSVRSGAYAGSAWPAAVAAHATRPRRALRRLRPGVTRPCDPPAQRNAVRLVVGSLTGSPRPARPPAPAGRGSRDHAASSRARSRMPGAASARSTARRSGRGAHSRRGTRTPTPAQSIARGVLVHVAGGGHATTAQPLASARTSVPWPAWQTTTSQRGIVRA